MKKLLKGLAAALLALLLFAAGMLVYIRFRMPKDMRDFDPTELRQAIEEVIDERVTTLKVHYDLRTAEPQELGAELSAFTSVLHETSSQYNYDVKELNYSVEQELLWLTLSLELKYSDDRPFNELPEVKTLREAAECVELALGSFETKVIFRGPVSWKLEELNYIANMVMNNCCTVAAIPRSYAYGVWEGEYDGTQACMMEFEYEVDENRLSICTDELTKALDAVARRVGSEGYSGDYELYMALAREVSAAAEYDELLMNATLNDGRGETDWINSSAYGALVTGRTVCTGYAMAFKALCERFALPCRVLNGSADGEGHSWNMIRLDGVTYYVDCTFADTSGSDTWYLIDPGSRTANVYVSQEGSELDW